jgi:hypothetical protein
VFKQCSVRSSCLDKDSAMEVGPIYVSITWPLWYSMLLLCYQRAGYRHNERTVCEEKSQSCET